MDLATLLGLVGALAAIATAILLGGGAGGFIDIPSVFIVLGGTAFVVLTKFPLNHTLGAFKVGLKAFLHKSDRPHELITQTVDLATVARKDGLLGLEQMAVRNPFLQRGIQLVVDGHEPAFVRKVLGTDINLTIERHEEGQAIFKAIADVAPAMGMIGTLIGLVQMMAHMEDPKSIGPAMAVALLTTLYGAVLANAVALPIADKLAHRSRQERLSKSLILEGISAIQEGLNPRVMEELLQTYLPGNQRTERQKDAA